MKSTNLTDEDKGLIKKELKNKFWVPMLMMVFVSFLLGGLFIKATMYKNHIILAQGTNWLFLLVPIIMVLGPVGYFYLYIGHDLFEDLNSGVKKVDFGVVESKLDKANKGVHINLAQDALSRPQIVEYALVVNGMLYNVTKEQFDSCQKNDYVRLDFASCTGRLLSIEVQKAKSYTV